MKKITPLPLAIIVLVTILFAACEKPETVIQKPSVNTKPVANAGEDTRVRLPKTLVLDGSASTDGEHNIVSYKWVLGSGPSTAIIANPNSVKTEVKFLTKGNYRFDLLVTDSGGRASGDFVQVVVLDTQLLNIKVAKDTIIKLPFNRAVLSVIGDDIKDLDLNWKKISGPSSFFIGAQNSSQTTVSDLVEGVYQFEINAKNSMQTTAKDTITITVLADNNSYTSEKVFEKLTWVDGRTTINNISSFIPTGTPFIVYVGLNSNTSWGLACSQEQTAYYIYDNWYGINNNVLTVGNFEDYSWSDTYVDQNTKIKIVY